MTNANLLLVFTKNLVHGQVKKRLAATVGNDRALRIYEQLVAYTASVVSQPGVDKLVYYSDYVESNDVWAGNHKAVQYGKDLGERMMNAFKQAFATGYHGVAIIGTDCFQLDAQIIESAYTHLQDADIVIGPAADGGYYLLAMKSFHPCLFEAITWSTEIVLKQTLAICVKKGLSYFLLQQLRDVDEEKDLETAAGRLVIN